MGRGRRFRVTRGGVVQLRLRDGEADLVRTLIGEMQQLIAAGSDPTLRRLYPTAYPQQEELQHEYEAMVHDQLMGSRFEALDVIERTLGHDVLDDEELGAWMRGINDLRLVLGTRLDVSEDGNDIDPDDPEASAYILYDWLGLLLSEIVDARSELL